MQKQTLRKLLEDHTNRLHCKSRFKVGKVIMGTLSTVIIDILIYLDCRGI